MNPARALVTGITGQDGSYLAESLLADGCEVHGLIRRSSSFNTRRIDHLYRDPHERGVRLHLHYADITDAGGLSRLVRQIAPDEVYHLAAQSHVRVSFDQPVFTGDVTALGTARLLDAVRDCQEHAGRPIRFYQASSSEMFGNAANPAPRSEQPSDPQGRTGRQSEQTPFAPRSPYGAAKAYAHFMAVNYREAYGMHVSCGILFNHESPRRGETFVTRKITRAAGRIQCGLQHKLYLGNLDARRDWGFAGDYVAAMRAMLRQERADDFVIATGVSHTVREFAEKAFARLGLDYRNFVETDPRYLRPTEVDNLCGDASKARRVLGWSPLVDFDGLVAMMVDADLALAERERALLQAGHPLDPPAGGRD